MFSFRSFMIVGLTFKSSMCFKLIFVSGVIQGFIFILLHFNFPVIPIPFIEEKVFSFLSLLGYLVKHQLTMYAWVYFWAFKCVPVFYLFLRQYHTVLINIALSYSLKSRSVLHPALFFFLKISQAFDGLLWFHINFSSVFSTSIKLAIRIFISIVLNL